MTTSSGVSLAGLIAEQLAQIESALDAATALFKNRVEESVSPSEFRNGSIDDRALPIDYAGIIDSVHVLQRQVDRLLFLNQCTLLFGSPLSLSDVVTQLMDALWQRHQLAFAGLVLGESELGPYFYYDLRGVLDARRYLYKQCPLPLWGELARALVRRLDPEEPDYLLIPDMDQAKRPTPEEFPWMPRTGSLMIMPLRKEAVAVGALILGSSRPENFLDIELRMELVEFAVVATHAIISAEAQEEIQARTGQLAGLQLFTRSLAATTSTNRLTGAIVNGVAELMDASNTLMVFHLDLTSAKLRELLMAAPGAYSDQQLVGIAANDDASILFAKLHRILQWTIDAAQSLFLDPSQPLESPENLYYNESGRAMLAPIIVGEISLGALYIEAASTRPGYDEEDMVVLRTAINTIAILLKQIG